MKCRGWRWGLLFLVGGVDKTVLLRKSQVVGKWVGSALLGILLAILSMPSILFWTNGLLGGHSTLDFERPEWVGKVGVGQEQQK